MVAGGWGGISIYSVSALSFIVADKRDIRIFFIFFSFPL